jgi:hypothetical protein
MASVAMKIPGVKKAVVIDVVDCVVVYEEKSTETYGRF